MSTRIDTAFQFAAYISFGFPKILIYSFFKVNSRLSQQYIQFPSNPSHEMSSPGVICISPSHHETAESLKTAEATFYHFPNQITTSIVVWKMEDETDEYMRLVSKYIFQ